MSEGRGEQGRRVLDEALRLLDVLQATRPATPPQAPPQAPRQAEGHGGPECRWCPVCRGIAQLREANPEALDRLTGAVVDLASAVRDLVAGVAGTSGPAGAPDGSEPVEPVEPVGAVVERVEVERIDVRRVDRAG